MPRKIPTHLGSSPSVPRRYPGAVGHFYNRARWRRLRADQLRRQPFCADPFGVHRGWPVPAVDVDHVVPVRQAPARVFDEANLQSLCKSCHGRKTRAEQQGAPRC